MIQEALHPDNKLKGCMIGRAAMDNPWLFSTMDKTYFNAENPNFSRREILQIYASYC
jgi:tRNA-dihydrouridine synthase